jgi:hypothetical protein
LKQPAIGGCNGLVVGLKAAKSGKQKKTAEKGERNMNNR